MKIAILQTLAAAAITLFSTTASSAPISVLESVVCSGDASGDDSTPCFVLPGVSAFVLLGDVTPESGQSFDLSDFLQFSGLLANASYDYSFSQSGESLFGFTYDADSVLNVFDSSNPIGTAFADASGNIYAGVFVEDSATIASPYSLGFSPVPAPTTATLLGLGLLLGLGGRRKIQTLQVFT
jgi:hypothetical protein